MLHSLDRHCLFWTTQYHIYRHLLNTGSFCNPLTSEWQHRRIYTTRTLWEKFRKLMSSIWTIQIYVLPRWWWPYHGVSWMSVHAQYLSTGMSHTPVCPVLPSGPDHLVSHTLLSCNLVCPSIPNTQYILYPGNMGPWNQGPKMTQNDMKLNWRAL